MSDFLNDNLFCDGINTSFCLGIPTRDTTYLPGINVVDSRGIRGTSPSEPLGSQTPGYGHVRVSVFKRWYSFLFLAEGGEVAYG